MVTWEYVQGKKDFIHCNKLFCPHSTPRESPFHYSCNNRERRRYSFFTRNVPLPNFVPLISCIAPSSTSLPPYLILHIWITIQALAVQLGSYTNQAPIWQKGNGFFLSFAIWKYEVVRAREAIVVFCLGSFTVWTNNCSGEWGRGRHENLQHPPHPSSCLQYLFTSNMLIRSQGWPQGKEQRVNKH